MGMFFSLCTSGDVAGRLITCLRNAKKIIEIIRRSIYPARAFLNFKRRVSSTFRLLISNRIMTYVHFIH